MRSIFYDGQVRFSVAYFSILLFMARKLFYCQNLDVIMKLLAQAQWVIK